MNQTLHNDDYEMETGVLTPDSYNVTPPSEQKNEEVNTK